MFSKLIIQLKNNSEKMTNWNMSSLFQGALMELLNDATAQWLHTGSRNPYSQYIQVEDGQIIWRIQALTEEAYDRILQPIYENKNERIVIKYQEIELSILKKELFCVKHSELLKEQYFKDYQRYFTTYFLTPTSFKSGGKYQNYPKVRWIFQSLMHKHDSIELKNQLYDEDVLDLLEEQVFITNYSLRSVYFHLEGAKIPSFVGKLTISVKSSQSMVNLANYLLMLGEYTGVGTKCAIGMGAIRVEHEEKKI